MSNNEAMSPFWKNVNEELQYQGMNLKTLSSLTGIPYTTITNGRNRANSIPTADVALKISKVLDKPLELLLGESAELPNDTSIKGQLKQDIQYQKLAAKYKSLILSLENCPEKIQDSFIRMAKSISENF
ncbi:MAG: helix-turn-helix transcriptional regulator [Treponema sp.]|nr:helix-turn-helix transcriptional regulator [Treponema sp.]